MVPRPKAFWKFIRPGETTVEPADRARADGPRQQLPLLKSLTIRGGPLRRALVKPIGELGQSQPLLRQVAQLGRVAWSVMDNARAIHSLAFWRHHSVLVSIAMQPDFVA